VQTFSDTPTRETVVPLLRGRFGHDYLYVAECPSTQRLLAAAAAEGAVAVTDFQADGRGRLGRRWETPPRTSLLMSLQLRPQVESDRLPELSLVAGRALAAAIEAVVPVRTAIKFPNDVLIGGRKVAGILAEATEGRVVLGIGVNVNLPADLLPVGERTPATSLLAETGLELDRRVLLVELLERLEHDYDEWNVPRGS
jgi:BirA family transcriptional regulator, biotin operon repressor / biotin---[acetyl-CoA-carboxylase] ligase